MKLTVSWYHLQIQHSINISTCWTSASTWENKEQSPFCIYKTYNGDDGRVNLCDPCFVCHLKAVSYVEKRQEFSEKALIGISS